MNHDHPIQHGTIGGYQAHIRRVEAACPPCKRAWRMYYQKRNDALPRGIDREKFELNQEKRRSGKDSRYDRKRGRDIGGRNRPRSADDEKEYYGQ